MAEPWPPGDPDGGEHGDVWVLCDAGDGGEACIAIAERLGCEFQAVRMRWTWRGLLAPAARHGSLLGLDSVLPAARPAMTLSAGRRGAAVAAWLKRECGSRMVHVGAAGRQAAAIDLHIVDRDGRADAATLPVLGLPHRLSPLALLIAAAAWRDRLSHLPHPRLVIMLGRDGFGGELPPSEAFRVARCLAEAVSGIGGAILAEVDTGAGQEAVAAFAGGLRDCLHLLHYSDEPGADPVGGFLASADAIVVAGHAPSHLLRACATTAPIYLAPIGGITPTLRRLQARLLAAGHVRPLETSIKAWKRPRLDEAGRIAATIQAAPRSASPAMQPGRLAPHGTSR